MRQAARAAPLQPAAVQDREEIHTLRKNSIKSLHCHQIYILQVAHTATQRLCSQLVTDTRLSVNLMLVTPLAMKA